MIDARPGRRQRRVGCASSRARARGTDVGCLWIAIIAVLLFLVVSPFVHLVLTASRPSDTGAFTFANYVTAYGRARYVEALVNSLELGVGAALLAGVLAVPLAWGVSRTNMPGRGLVRMLVLATFITPPYTGAVAWILLAGPERRLAQPHLHVADRRRGGAVQHLQLPRPRRSSSRSTPSPTSSSSPRRRSSWSRPRWRTRPTSWARAPGAPCARVTLPLALPAILGGLIICFLEAIALFGSPAMIAIPARFNVVTTQLFQFFGNPGAGRGGRRLCHAAARHHRAAGPGAAADDAPQGLRVLTGKGGERRPIALGPLALGDVRLCHARGHAVGLPALSVPAAGRLRQGMGPGLRARQYLAAELPFHPVRARHRRRSRC